MAPYSFKTARKLGTSMARVFKIRACPRKNVNMASLFRNIVRKTLVNLLEVHNAKRLESRGIRFQKGEDISIPITYYLSQTCQSTDPCGHESYHFHRKESRTFPYTVFAVLGMAVACSQDSEEGNSPPISPFASPSHHGKRSANGRFTKAAKGKKKSLVPMRQGYRNYFAKRKLAFENYTDENEPPPKCITRSTQVSG